MPDTVETTAVAEREKSSRDARRVGDALASLAFFLFLWFFWGVRYGDYLFVCQENSLFIPRWDFLTGWLSTPDGFLCWVSAFFLQFSYYPLLGGAIYAAAFALTQVCCARLLGLRGSLRLLSFLPPCFLTVAATWPSYYVYVPYNMPIVFAPACALLWTLLVVDVWRRVRSPIVRFALAVIYVAIAYPFVAFWAPFAVLLAAALEPTVATGDELGTAKPRLRVLLRVVGMAALAILIPCLYYRFNFFTRVAPANIFTLGLWEDVRYDRNSLTAIFSYWVAALAPLTIWLIALIKSAAALLSRGVAKKNRESRSERKRAERERAKAVKKEAKLGARGASESEVAQSEKERERRRERLRWATLAIMCLLVALFSYHSKQFFLLLKATRALDEEDWERVVELDEQNPFPIDGMTQLRNVALFRLGRLADDAFARPLAGLATLDVTETDYTLAVRDRKIWYRLKMWFFNQRRRTEDMSNRVLIEMIYCYWGQTNIGARLAMNNFIAAEDRSIFTMKTLATAALVNGEDKLARRYLSELERTLFYRNWARVRLAYLDSPGFYEGVRDFHNDAQIDETISVARASRIFESSDEDAAKKWNVDLKELAKLNDSIQEMRKLRPEKDFATTKAYPNLVFLYGVVRPEEFETASKEKRQLLLVSLLMRKKGDEFLEMVERYIKEYPGERLPRAIEEGYATWLYNKEKLDWNNSGYQFSQSTVERFSAFVSYIADLVKTAPIDDPYSQSLIRDSWRGTYWAFAIDGSVFNHY